MILQNVRLIDGTGRVQDPTAIQIEGDRIAAVGDASAVSPGEEVLDLSGKTVMPGLINCHTHLCHDGSPNPHGARQARSFTEIVLVAADHAACTVRAGITMVRDMGGYQWIDLGLKKAINDGIAKGPRILASGRILCMTGGHGYLTGLEVDGPDAVRQGAREQIKAGADVIKVMATGGVMTPCVQPGAAQLTYEELRAVVEEAEKASRLTASHAQGTEGIKNAVRAGVDSIEHGFYLDAEAIDMMLERGTAFVPTLAALFHIIEAGVEGGVQPFVVEKAKGAYDAQLDSFRRAREAGVTIAAGNDGGTPFNRAENLASELERLVAAGMSPAEALAAATTVAASLLRCADDLGTVEQGKLADLLVLNADPLADISAVRQVHMVIKGGQRV